ncbi:MAG: two-component regulator propeller domain-containing protein [bacterium]
MKTRLSLKVNFFSWTSLPFLLFLCGMGTFLHARKYFTRTYTEADRLSSSMVYDVAQDSAGLIWFATRSGITSYDGINFHNYGVPDGLPVQGIFFLAVDEKGNSSLAQLVRVPYVRD